MFHVEHLAEDDFHTIKKANAMRWPFLFWASYLDVDGHIKCHGYPRWNQGSTWNIGTITVTSEQQLVSYCGLLTLLNVVFITSILT